MLGDTQLGFYVILLHFPTFSEQFADLQIPRFAEETHISNHMIDTWPHIFLLFKAFQCFPSILGAILSICEKIMLILVRSIGGFYDEMAAFDGYCDITQIRDCQGKYK